MGESILPKAELSNMDEYMLQKKLELMMDMNNKKIINELSKLTTVISSINENIFQIRGLLNGKAVVSETPANESRVVHKIEPAAYEKNQSEINKVKNDDKPKPRYGDYKPEDVSIDKFFYFGKNK